MSTTQNERQALITALRASTGINYSVSVSKGQFQLEVVSFNRGTKKPVEVSKVGPALPEAEFMDFLRNYKA